MPREKTYPYDIQERAIHSLRNDFTKAADKYQRALVKSLTTGPVIHDSQWYRHSDAIKDLQFLLKGAEGKYLGNSWYRIGANRENDLWHDYLQSIDRCAHGFGCIPTNNATMDKLIAQNGPKKMEQRLAGYLKKKIRNTASRKPC